VWNHTVLELGKPFKNLSSSHCLLYRSYLQHFESFCKTFSSL
jgi:hypothetical protein